MRGACVCGGYEWYGRAMCARVCGGDMCEDVSARARVPCVLCCALSSRVLCTVHLYARERL